MVLRKALEWTFQIIQFGSDTKPCNLVDCSSGSNLGSRDRRRSADTAKASFSRREPAGWSVAGALRHRKIMQFQDVHDDLAVVGYHVVEIKQVITERSVPTSALVAPNIELRPSDVRRSGGYKHRIHRYCAVD
jgi:hypothetical protein